MNHIRFMLNRINDYALLHEKREEMDSDMFDEIKMVTVDHDHTQEYCQSVIDDVKVIIPEIKEVNYKGCLDRISNEVYELLVEKAKYTVTLTIDSFSGKATTIQVDITPEYSYARIENCYDRLLERLKIELKKRLKKDWTYCIWLIDEPSEVLCAELYSHFFEKENQIRSFVNRVLTFHLGAEWLCCVGLEKYYESAKKKAEDFIQKVPEMEDINTDLLSLTLESLFDIVFNENVYEENTVITRNDLKTLENMFRKKVGHDSIKDYILKKRKKKANIWNDIFAQYFDDSEKFRADVHNFISSRNHIVHNKLISFNAYSIILSELDEIQKDLDNGEEKFRNAELSDEILLTREAEEESFLYDEREFWRTRVSDETGIDVLDKDEILDKFSETVNDIYEAVMKQFHFDPCYEIGDLEELSDDGITHMFSVKSNADEEASIDIIANVYIDDDMGSSSEMILSCQKDGGELFRASVRYINGEGSEDDEFRIQVDCDSVYDDSDVKDFVKKLVAYINNNLNSLPIELNELKYEAEKNGAAHPVADFPCEECGNYGVSIMESFYPIGKCCYCGCENDVHVCSMCGTVFDNLGGKGELCNGCLPGEGTIER